LDSHQGEEFLPDATVGSALAWARARFARASIESPQRTAEILLGHILAWDRVRILAHPEVLLPAPSLAELTVLVARRCAGEPLQYITGSQEFFGLPFRVTPHVLIPRPETEVLVEKAIEVAPRRGEVRAADVGTGSGCIAVAFARFVPHARVAAIDISGAALAVARENALKNDVLPRITFVRGDLLEMFRPRPCFHIILSNPPYIPGSEIAALDPVVRDHEPRQALFGGESGLDLYRLILKRAGDLLFQDGFLLMEIGAGQAEAVSALVLKNRFRVDSILEDLRGIPRCVVARKVSEGDNG
jgi:release factor glutamine methyltransferase